LGFPMRSADYYHSGDVLWWYDVLLCENVARLQSILIVLDLSQNANGGDRNADRNRNVTTR